MTGQKNYRSDKKLVKSKPRHYRNAVSLGKDSSTTPNVVSHGGGTAQSVSGMGTRSQVMDSS